MIEPKILIIDKIEDLYEDKGNVPNPTIGKLVSDSAGNQVKVKVGRGGHLKNKWDELLIGRAYSFKMGEFKGYPFVEDFEEVKDIFVKEAAEKVRDAGAEMKPRSYALAYAKDLAVADRIKTDDILVYADWFSAWLTVGFKAEKPIEEPSQPPLTEPEVPKPTIDMPALKAQVTDLLKSKQITSNYLKEKYGISKLNDITSLSDELKQKFVEEIQERLNS